LNLLAAKHSKFGANVGHYRRDITLHPAITDCDSA